MKRYFGKSCLLKSDFLNAVIRVDRNALTKRSRPYLILNLKYKGCFQVFTIPFQSNVKTTLNDSFWDTMPARLETSLELKQGLMYGKMIPLCENAVYCLERPKTIPPINYDVQIKTMVNILNRSEDSVPAHVVRSLNMLKSFVENMGISCFENENFVRHYRIVSEAVLRERIRMINDGLSPDKNGRRRIIDKAQKYLSRYEAFLRGKKPEMPFRFTNIEKLIHLAHNFHPLDTATMKIDSGASPENDLFKD